MINYALIKLVYILEPTPQCKFGDEVKRLLKAVLSSDSYFSCNHITPYGYQVSTILNSLITFDMFFLFFRLIL